MLKAIKSSSTVIIKQPLSSKVCCPLFACDLTGTLSSLCHVLRLEANQLSCYTYLFLPVQPFLLRLPLSSPVINLKNSLSFHFLLLFFIWKANAWFLLQYQPFGSSLLLSFCGVFLSNPTGMAIHSMHIFKELNCFPLQKPLLLVHCSLIFIIFVYLYWVLDAWVSWKTFCFIWLNYRFCKAGNKKGSPLGPYHHHCFIRSSHFHLILRYL